jgi:hypothetical protein
MALRRQIGRAAATSAAARAMAAAKATPKAWAQSVGSESVGGQTVSLDVNTYSHHDLGSCEGPLAPAARSAQEIFAAAIALEQALRRQRQP